ncbi:MAG: hypothetical protein H0W30_03195 [Gemmatimonadaceae bacterium]|nr:hypothetical protein [Gemmatimonadaceae bacterium]MDQ3517679.1 hypothetical protein [Gemmatimonadota bacterium]
MILKKCQTQGRDELLRTLLTHASTGAKPIAPAGRTSPRLESAPLSRRELGCTIVRRISDNLGRHWVVREAGIVRQSADTRRNARPRSLIFRCVTRGVRAEIRRAPIALHALTDARLLLMLARAE